MSDSDLEVKFGASTEEVTAGAKHVKDEVKGVGEHVDALGARLTHIGELFGIAFSAEKLSS